MIFPNFFQPKLGQSQIFFKGLRAGLTNPRDISDSFTVTPLVGDWECVEWMEGWASNCAERPSELLPRPPSYGHFGPRHSFVHSVLVVLC